jgi:parallel beta-helix repeat protein
MSAISDFLLSKKYKKIDDKVSDMCVNVKVFGAVGDGVTDDSSAIQLAINYCISSGNNNLFFPEGIYRVKAQFILPNNIHIFGNNAQIDIDPGTWDGTITGFHALFTTVDVPAAPQPASWRLGTGTISHSGIVIENLTFNLNRDGDVLDNSKMVLAFFNVIRFEDAENCVVRNCRFIDKMTESNHHGYSHVVFFVRSKRCSVEHSYFERTSMVFIAECSDCGVYDSDNVYGNSSPIETKGGDSLKIIGNHVYSYWENTSCFGINSLKCEVKRNIIDSANLAGIVLGHDNSSDPGYYGVLFNTDGTICEENYIKSGNLVNSNYGILLQNGSNTTIAKNTILDLGKRPLYSDDAGVGIRVIGNGDVSRFTNILIEKNIISNATCGIRLSDGENVIIGENDISNTLSTIQIGQTTNPVCKIFKNNLSNSLKSIIVSSGYCTVEKNYIHEMTDATCYASLTGFIRYVGNIHINTTVMQMNFFKSLDLRDNVFLNDTVQPVAISCNNEYGTETAYLKDILLSNNQFAGYTNLLYFYHVNDFGSGYFIEDTVKALDGSLTWDPASLADGSGETSADISVSGAALGDFIVVSAPYDLAGVCCNGYVSAANVVKIRIQNETGNTIDFSSGVWKVKVIKA